MPSAALASAGGAWADSSPDLIGDVHVCVWAATAALGSLAAGGTPLICMFGPYAACVEGLFIDPIIAAAIMDRVYGGHACSVFSIVVACLQHAQTITEQKIFMSDAKSQWGMQAWHGGRGGSPERNG